MLKSYAISSQILYMKSIMTSISLHYYLRAKNSASKSGKDFVPGAV